VGNGEGAPVEWQNLRKGSTLLKICSHIPKKPSQLAAVLSDLRSHRANVGDEPLTPRPSIELGLGRCRGSSEESTLRPLRRLVCERIPCRRLHQPMNGKRAGSGNEIDE